MDIYARIRELALHGLFFEAGYLNVDSLRFYPEVRRICEGNACRCYGATWACPPATGTLDECRERVARYRGMLLFSGRYELEDSFDFEGMSRALRSFKDAVDAFDRRVAALMDDYLLLSNEGCLRCASCTYPDAPCRFPQKLHPALEGFGFIVSELAREAGICYNSGANTVTYFGALLFDPRANASMRA